MLYTDSTKLRGYFFGNMYLSPIQQGIQCAHVVTKMFDKYAFDSSPATLVLSAWARDGVTKILLNGGYQSNLQVIYDIFQKVNLTLNFPYAKFHEEDAALNGALTSVGIVVPAEAYDYKVNTNWLIGLHSFLVHPDNSDVYGDVHSSFASERQAVREMETATDSVERIMEILENRKTDNHLQEREVNLYLLHRTLKSCRLA